MIVIISLFALFRNNHFSRGITMVSNIHLLRRRILEEVELIGRIVGHQQHKVHVLATGKAVDNIIHQKVIIFMYFCIVQC